MIKVRNAESYIRLRYPNVSRKIRRHLARLSLRSPLKSQLDKLVAASLLNHRPRTDKKKRKKP